MFMFSFPYLHTYHLSFLYNKEAALVFGDVFRALLDLSTHLACEILPYKYTNDAYIHILMCTHVIMCALACIILHVYRQISVKLSAQGGN